MNITTEECPFKQNNGFCDNKKVHSKKCKYLKSKGRSFRDCIYYKERK